MYMFGIYLFKVAHRVGKGTLQRPEGIVKAKDAQNNSIL